MKAVQQRSSTKNVLVVDQDPEMRLLLSNLLQSPLVNTLEAADPQEALRRLEGEVPIHLVISEMDLPGHSGLEFMKQVRSRRAEVPVVFVTENDEIDSYLSAMDEGAFEYLPKPPETRDFVRVVERACALV